jgi:hypothetical protein
MSLAQRTIGDVEEFSREAQERLSSARYRDLAFVVKRKIGDRFASDDVDMLVKLLLEVAFEKGTLTREVLVDGLRKYGRSPQKSEELATAVMQ